MEDFQEQITAIYLKNKLIEDFFQQKKQTLQDLTQSLNSAAVRCLCKIVAPIKPHHVFLSALSATYSKLFSLYFKFSGQPWLWMSTFGHDERTNADFETVRVCLMADGEGIFINALVSPVISPPISTHLQDDDLNFPYLQGLRLADPVRI